MKKLSVMVVLLTTAVVCVAQSRPGEIIDRALDQKMRLESERQQREEAKKREVNLAEKVSAPFAIGFGGVYNWNAPQKIETKDYTVYLETTYPSNNEADYYSPQLALRFELKKGVKTFPADKITFPEQSIGVGRVSPRNSNGYEFLKRCEIFMRIEHADQVTMHRLGFKMC